MTKENINQHWSDFLDARIKVISWMTNELNFDDDMIAIHLSLNEEQVGMLKASFPNLKIDNDMSCEVSR